MHLWAVCGTCSWSRRCWRAGTSRDEIILTAGTEIGALLVDGLGDGVTLECASEDLDFLRTTSFGLLQARASHALACCDCTHRCAAVGQWVAVALSISACMRSSLHGGCAQRMPRSGRRTM